MPVSIVSVPGVRKIKTASVLKPASRIRSPEVTGKKERCQIKITKLIRILAKGTAVTHYEKSHLMCRGQGSKSALQAPQCCRGPLHSHSAH